MKTWTRLSTDERCGSCGGEVLSGHPICLISFFDGKAVKLRCEACAGPAPETVANKQRDAERAELKTPRERLPYREDP